MARRRQEMERQEIESYLQELGDELERRGFHEPVRILVFGGVYMIFMIQNRMSTEDVDIVLLDMEEMTKVDASEKTRRFQAAVKAVARRQKIRSQWVNDDGAMFYKGFTPQAEMHLWREFNRLAVYLPRMEAMLVLKLMGFRPKDKADIDALCQQLNVTTRRQAQHLLNDYVAGRWQREYRVDSALDELFDE